MAYFDSAKNRAMWERELAGLRTERERRRQNGFRPEANRASTARQVATDQNPFRRRINLEELERIELMASGARRVARPRRRGLERSGEELGRSQGGKGSASPGVPGAAGASGPDVPSASRGDLPSPQRTR